MRNQFLKIFPLLLMMSCSSKSHLEVRPTEPTQEEITMINEAQAKLDNENFTEAGVMIDQFIVKYPRSLYSTSAQLGRARVMEAQGRPKEALDLYRQIIGMTKSLHPEIAAEAKFRSSFSYEILKDDVRALSTLKDAESFSESLPVETKGVEIPARRAQLLAKAGHMIQAQQEVDKADQAMKELLPVIEQKKGRIWIARLYYQLGMVRNSNATDENDLIQVMMALNVGQRYHLKAIDMNCEPWSEKSARYLTEKYSVLFELIKNPTHEAGVDPIVDQNRRNEIQLKLAKEFIQLLENAESFKPYQNNIQSPLVKEFYNHISTLQNQTEKILYSSKDRNLMTEESLRVNAIKREGKIIEQEGHR